MIDELSQERNSTCINNKLSKFSRMFTDLAEGRSCNSFESRLWFLNAKNKKWNSSNLDNRHSKLSCMFGDI
jgi:hypothetical protein